MHRLPVLFLAFALGVSGQPQDPQNLAEILTVAALKLEAASGITNDGDRASALDEVQILYLRANALDSRNVDALYHLGVVSWMKVFPAVVAARRVAAMDPETPGPVRDDSSRAVLNARYRSEIDYAIANLEQAIDIDPSNSDAMAYLQMAYRARADLMDTRSQWDDDWNAAGRWREKAYEVASAKPMTLPLNLDRPAQRPLAPWSLVFMPSAITVDPQEMLNKLTHIANAGCPAGLHVAGFVPPVTLGAVIDRDGSVLYLERDINNNDGADAVPDAVINAAMQAAREWTFQPTLLNGKATLVKTAIVVSFNQCSRN